MQTPVLNAPDLWQADLPFPDRDSHKYTRGSLWIQGGDEEHTGAARLAARAALRIGAGLVTILCDKVSLPVYAGTNLAVMTRVADTEADFLSLIRDAKINAFLIGPASGVTDATQARALYMIKTGKPCILDADALTVFANDPEELFTHTRASKRCAMTPHAGEFARLFPDLKDMAMDVAAIQASQRSGAIILLKGSETMIAAPDGTCIINRHSHPALATAGSGDVLSGMIAGLLAAGMTPLKAALASAWIHGDIAQKLGYGLIADDLETRIPSVLQEFYAASRENKE